MEHLKKSALAYMKLMSIIHNERVERGEQIEHLSNTQGYLYFVYVSRSRGNGAQLGIVQYDTNSVTPITLAFATRYDAENSIEEHKELWKEYYGLH